MSILDPKPLGDNFSSSVSSWDGYDQYLTLDKQTALSLREVMIRDFVSGAEVIPKQVFTLSNYQMDALSLLTMNQIQTAGLVVSDENWGTTTGTTFVVGPDSSYRNSNSLRVTVTTGTHVIQSLMTNKPIDITSGLKSLSDVTVKTQTPSALPYSWLNSSPALSYFEMTSSPSGSFTGLDTVRAPLYRATGGLLPNGCHFAQEGSTPALDDVFTHPGSLAGNIGSFDPTAVTGVRITITAVGSGTLILFGILASTGTSNGFYVRPDTLRQRIYLVPNPPADPLLSSQYPPVMWRSNGLAGLGDPKPYDVEFSLAFFTGSKVYGGSVSLYARENTLDPVTMVDLEGTMMSSLDGNPVPDFSPTAGYLVRTQADLEIYNQAGLDGEDQLTLSRSPDEELGSYVKFDTTWTPSSATMSIRAAEGIPYSFSISGGLSANSHYLMFCTLVDETARIQIYQSSLSGEVGNLVQDSGSILDDDQFTRRRGRIGFRAVLGDGDGYLANINDRKAVFGEYRSRPMKSTTPVMGAQLYSEYTPDTQHFKTFTPSKLNIASTIVKFFNGAHTITTIGPVGFQGLSSNLFSLYDLENSGIEFNLLIDESSSIGSKDISTYLVDQYEGRYTQIGLSPIIVGQKTRVRAKIPSGFAFPTGAYSLMIAQPSAQKSKWSVSDISIFTRSVVWGARPQPPNPFYPNSEPFIPFRGLIGDGNSVQFPHRGNGLQVRGQALRQDATISKIQILPKYAELGNIIEA